MRTPQTAPLGTCIACGRFAEPASLYCLDCTPPPPRACDSCGSPRASHAGDCAPGADATRAALSVSARCEDCNAPLSAREVDEHGNACDTCAGARPPEDARDFAGAVEQTAENARARCTRCRELVPLVDHDGECVPCADASALDRIAEQLAAPEWNADTLDNIAAIIEQVRTIEHAELLACCGACGAPMVARQPIDDNDRPAYTCTACLDAERFAAPPCSLCQAHEHGADDCPHSDLSAEEDARLAATIAHARARADFYHDAPPTLRSLGIPATPAESLDRADDIRRRRISER